MRSRTDVRRGQSGQSLVEALVAALLVGIALFAGLQALDVATIGARTAAHEAWGRCVARGELEAISASAWAPGSYPGPNGVTAQVTWTSPDQQLQKVTVLVRDPGTGTPLGSAAHYEVYKAKVLSGAAGLSAADVSAVLTSCQALLG